MTAPDFFTVEWSPTRGLAVVRSTCDEIPWAECDEAAHQLVAAGNMARRINDGDPAEEEDRCTQCGIKDGGVKMRPGPRAPERTCIACAWEAPSA
jgi:hypothetical protein